MPRLLFIVPFAMLLGPLPAPVRAETFSQLISTRYAQGATLPQGSDRPKKSFDFVPADKLPPGAKLLSAARAGNGAIWVVTEQGPFRWSGSSFVPLEVGPRHPEPGQPPAKGYARVVEVESDPIGHIWVATDRGLYVTDGAEWWQSLDRRDGVPYEPMTTLHLAQNGDLWAGTHEGAWRLHNGDFRYFLGQRWLPDNHVKAIWTDATARVWIETATGTACIEERPTSLAEKAAHFESILRQRHNRRGYIAQIDLKVAGDPSQGYHFDVSDNDGLWTAMYVGGMALRYGATKSPEARKSAKESLEALLNLERLSGISGFPARALVLDSELKAGLRVDLDYMVRAPGVNQKAWFRSKNTEGVWCKGDTSSDELDGHYFAWYLYHDLVADDAEKKEIAAVVKRVTDHILEHDYTLVDHTGIRTRWGIWRPAYINHDPFYYDLRPLNSLEILCFLKVAHHITGDSKYAKAYDDLVTNHHYLLNSLMMRRGTTGGWPDINHSDDELLYLAYYPLIMLEKDPARRRLLVQSIARTWEDSAFEQSIRPEHSPFYNFVYGATTGRECDVQDATTTLEDWPWELISWTVKNSHRHDVTIRTAPGMHRHRIQIDRVLPASERSQGRWNSSPWTPDEGSNGRVEYDGVAWTLSYWLGVYHKLLPAE
jgi:hypothetical protein